MVKAEQPDVVLVATGSEVTQLPIPVWMTLRLNRSERNWKWLMQRCYPSVTPNVPRAFV